MDGAKTVIDRVETKYPLFRSYGEKNFDIKANI